MISNNSYPLSSYPLSCPHSDSKREYCWGYAESVHCHWINCELAALGLAAVCGSKFKKTPKQTLEVSRLHPVVKMSQDDTESQGDAICWHKNKGTKAAHIPSKLCFGGLWGKTFCVSPRHSTCATGFYTFGVSVGTCKHMALSLPVRGSWPPLQRHLRIVW